MIRVFDIPDGYDVSAGLAELLPHLPQWRLRKALSYHRDIGRFLCAKSFLILEEMLREECGLDRCPEFSYESHGKPFFRECQSIFFNMSHCRRGIACAVMDRPVGIDIEEIRFDRELAEAILDKAEFAAVSNAEEPDIEFTKLWTRKESYLKLTGEGLRDDMENVLSGEFAVDFATTTDLSAGYVFSTATWKKV